MNYFDLIVFVLLALAIISGVKSGFKQAFYNFLSIVLSIVCGYLFYKPLSGFLEFRFQLLEKLQEFFIKNLDPNTSKLLVKDIQELISKHLENLSLPQWAINILKQIYFHINYPGNASANITVPELLAKVTLGLVSFAAIAILSYIVFKILLRIFLKSKTTSAISRFFGAFSNFVILFLIIVWVLAIYTSLGLSIFIPSGYAIMLIESSFTYRIALKLIPIFSLIIKNFTILP